MLAMKFEDSIFKAASDLDNYRSTIGKRIKKLQKHYAKQQQQQQQDATTSEGGGKLGEGTAEQLREREILLESELREEYGPRLLYIVKHATLAIQSTRDKQGDHKADILQQHVNNAKQWAVHLGLHLPVVPTTTTTTGGVGATTTTLFVRQERRDMEFLTKLKGYLESRVDNIRSHIIKMADPDYFLEEALSKMDDTLLRESITEALRTAAAEATITKDDVRGGRDELEVECSIEQMHQFVERLNIPIPIPRRYQDGDILKAAVARIEKFRAGAQALYTYIMLPVLDKTQYRGMMAKSFSGVIECLNDLENDYNNLVKEEEEERDGNNMTDKDGKRIIVLEDAWNNPMQFTELESSSTDGEEGRTTPPTIEMDKPPKTKRQKTTTNNDAASSSTLPMVIRSRYLLTPGRKPLSTLLPALQRKRAILVRGSSVTYVKLVFGTAFEMTIYFVPLLVTIRAIDHTHNNSSEDYNTVSSAIGGHNWPSLYQGLQQPPCQQPLNTIDNTRSSSSNSSSSLSVLGVTGSYELLGPIVAKQLEYASCQATYVLRRCFTETMKDKKYTLATTTKKIENEIELLEAGAFIRFLRIARATYSPDLVDVDL
jgi:hypothetical protein